jgi:hypothetical protein
MSVLNCGSSSAEAVAYKSEAFYAAGVNKSAPFIGLLYWLILLFFNAISEFF